MGLVHIRHRPSAVQREDAEDQQRFDEGPANVAAAASAKRVDRRNLLEQSLLVRRSLV